MLGLPEETQKLIGVAACLGHSFSAALLAVAAEIDRSVIVQHLERVRGQSLIWQATAADADASGRLTHERSDGSEYGFVHDSVQKAARALVSSGEAAFANLRIGRHLRGSLVGTAAPGTLFDVVTHLNAAVEKITDLREREDLIELNLLAAERGHYTAHREPDDVAVLCEALAGDVGPDVRFVGPDQASEQAVIERARRSDKGYDVGWCHILRARLYFLLGDYERAMIASRKSAEWLEASVSMLQVAEHHYQHGLIAARMARQPGRARGVARATKRASKLMRHWAVAAPWTFAHKASFLEAELACLEGNWNDAFKLCEAAMDGARHNGFVQDEAMAAEALVRALVGMRSTTSARGSLLRAVEAYGRWGARLKADGLTGEFATVLGAGDPMHREEAES